MMTQEDVRLKIEFARRRASDITALIAAGTLSNEPAMRQQLAEEFFFHAAGALDLVAQFVNERRSLGMDSEDVSIKSVANKLDPADPMIPALRALYVNTRGASVPIDPYSDEGLLFRLYNYRHQVTHRGRNPFNFVLSKPQAAFLRLDPRSAGSGRGLSVLQVPEDFNAMLRLVTRLSQTVLALV